MFFVVVVVVVATKYSTLKLLSKAAAMERESKIIDMNLLQQNFTCKTSRRPGTYYIYLYDDNEMPPDYQR